MNELTDLDESELGWVYPAPPIEFIAVPLANQRGETQLVSAQGYVDVVFHSSQTNANWILVECEVFNSTDLTPFNIAPGIITSRTLTGFRIQLEGLPDTSNYFLRWAINGNIVPPQPATTYALSGPASGHIGAAATFTVALFPDTTVTGTVTVTPSDGGGGGTFSPTSVALTMGAPSVTFTYTPGLYGNKTIATTNASGLNDPASVTFASTASTYTFSGPSTGTTGVASTNFTVALPVGGVVIGAVTVTPHATGGGTFTPATINLTTGASSNTFTYTPASVGAKTISVTNNGGLTDPANLTYTASAPGLADGDPVSTWPDSSINGNDATQSGTARPTFKTNIVNSKPVVRFAGISGNALIVPAISGASPWTVFSVMKPSGSSVEMSAIGGTPGSGLYSTVFGGDGNLYASSRTVATAGAAPTLYTSFSVLTTVATTIPNISIYTNGTLLITGVGSVSNAADFARIVNATSSDGDEAEIIIYNVALSGTDRANIEKYLGTKYAITVAGGSAVQPDTVTGLKGWWKADSL